MLPYKSDLCLGRHAMRIMTIRIMRMIEVPSHLLHLYWCCQDVPGNDCQSTDTRAKQH
jgi:hypothetical protein